MIETMEKIADVLRVLFLLAIMSMPVLFLRAKAIEKDQALEKGSQQQFWDIHQYPVKEGANYLGTIHVFKFQVGKTMVCKAMFFKEGYQTEKNGMGGITSMALAMTATSLGDVPCD